MAAIAKLPFHTDHIGSLIRPTKLLEIQQQADQGDVTGSQLQEARRTAIAAVVQKQRDHHVRTLTSGEFDRKHYFSGFFEKIGGFRQVAPVPWEMARLSAPPMAVLKSKGEQYPMAAVCEGRMRYDGSPYLESWKMLRDAVPRELWAECKFTMPPPCYFHLRLAPGRCYSAEAYGSDEDFFADLAGVYRREMRTLYDEGLRNLQIDDPTLAYFCSKAMRESLEAEGVDPDELFEMYLKAHNDCLEGRPPGLHVGLHICRGNFSKSLHFSEGSYEKIAERLLTTLHYDTFLLEYDDARSGGFEPLRFLPREKNVVLGVVTTKDTELEDPDAITKRVFEAAGIIAEGQGRSVGEVMEHIGISPQCGFASVSIGAEGMTEERMFAKLKLVRDIAGELWTDGP